MIYKRKSVCRSCGYSVEVYDGKGFFNQHVVMMSCMSCHRIEPIVVGGVIGDVAPSFSSEVGRLCLHCGSDEIRVWDGVTCPCCGAQEFKAEGEWTPQ